MTSRERFIAALEHRPLTGQVPHFELVFFSDNGFLRKGPFATSEVFVDLVVRSVALARARSKERCKGFWIR